MEISLHDKQFEAIECKKQYVFCIAGHRGGKTFVGAIWTGVQIQNMPDNSAGAIIAPTYPILRQATLDTFFRLFPQYRRFYKEQKQVIELPGSKKIYIRSADDPLSLEGMTLSWAWGDEMGMWKRLAWDIVRARLSTTQGQFFGTTTPYNLGFLFTDVWEPWKKGEDGSIAIFNWRSVDNPYFPKDFAEAEKKRLSVTEYSRRYEGVFSKMQGLVYDLPGEQIMNWNDIAPYVTNPDITIAGVDWGFRNPAAICILRQKDGVWYVVDEYYQTEKTTQDILEAAGNLQRKWNVNRWYADYAEPDRIEEFRRAGFQIIEGVKDLEGGISKIREFIIEKRFYVHDQCKNFIEEMNFYHYEEQKEGKAYKDEPAKLNDHLMDACRYAISTYVPKVQQDRRFEQKVLYNRAIPRNFS